MHLEEALVQDADAVPYTKEGIAATVSPRVQRGEGNGFSPPELKARAPRALSRNPDGSIAFYSRPRWGSLGFCLLCGAHGRVMADPLLLSCAGVDAWWLAHRLFLWADRRCGMSALAVYCLFAPCTAI